VVKEEVRVNVMISRMVGFRGSICRPSLPQLGEFTQFLRGFRDLDAASLLDGQAFFKTYYVTQ